MVAASKSASASRSLPRLTATSSGAAGPQMRDDLVVRAAGARSKASAVSRIWPRTRSRNSWLAARPKVINSISSNEATPSAR